PSVLSLSDPVFDPAGLESSAASRRVVPVRASDAAPVDHEDASASARAGYVGAGGLLARLPGTALETAAIRRAFGESSAAVQVLQATDATEARLRATLPGKRYVHLATHGLVDEQQGALFGALAL